MSMSEWARREVEIACKREAPDRKDGEWDYGCSCYESALKAYLSLMEDEHSGFSFGATANILRRLLESKPLTPIEDMPEVWNDITSVHDSTVTFQCKRMSSLFKDVRSDGSVTYHDVDRSFCKDAITGITFSNGLASRFVDEVYPIRMPYYPPIGRYEVSVAEWLTDRKNGDFDTVAYFSIKAPDGTITWIDRYFAEIDGEMKTITRKEYEARVLMHHERERLEAKE